MPAIVGWRMPEGRARRLRQHLGLAAQFPAAVARRRHRRRGPQQTFLRALRHSDGLDHRPRRGTRPAPEVRARPHRHRHLAGRLRTRHARHRNPGRAHEAGGRQRRWDRDLAGRPALGSRRCCTPSCPACPGHDIWARDFAGSVGRLHRCLRRRGVAARSCPRSMRSNSSRIGASWGGTKSLAAPIVDVRRSARPPSGTVPNSCCGSTSVWSIQTT